MLKLLWGKIRDTAEVMSGTGKPMVELQRVVPPHTVGRWAHEDGGAKQSDASRNQGRLGVPTTMKGNKERVK